MQLKDYPFEQLPFTKLFRTYVSDFSSLESFYPANPFDPGSIEGYAEKSILPCAKEEKVELLKTFNERFDLDEAALKNIERLNEDGALAIVTGQQLGLFGGPLFTALKIITTLHLANMLEKRLKRPVIPVFWLADEDHDFEEVNHVHLLDRDELKSFGLENERESSPPVADITLSSGFESFRDSVRKAFFDTEFSEPLWQLLNTTYASEVRMDEAFGKLIARLFSKHGLILAGSNCKSVKEVSKESMKLAIRKADEIKKALEEQSEALERDYHRQATIYDSNLFYLDETGRTKIVRNGESWKTEAGQNWTTQALLEEIDTRPDRFSPNVFLRPLLQDLLVPTLGYVAGPGELAYYGQMKKMYELFNCSMPIIFPRMSSTIIEPAIERIIGELPFELADYDKRIEDLESEYINQTEQPDIEAIFKKWKQQVEEISDTGTSAIEEIDPTLEGAAGKATAVYFGELDKLKGKVYRSVKQQEETQLKRIRKIKASLFPDGIPQERVISFVYFMNKYGLDIWDRLLDELHENEDFSRHKLIYL